MAQASPTTCAHNAPGQAVVPGRPTPCRQCGALIEPTPRSGNTPAGVFNAAFPGDGNTTNQAWAFAQ